MLVVSRDLRVLGAMPCREEFEITLAKFPDLSELYSATFDRMLHDRIFPTLTLSTRFLRNKEFSMPVWQPQQESPSIESIEGYSLITTLSREVRIQEIDVSDYFRPRPGFPEEEYRDRIGRMREVMELADQQIMAAFLCGTPEPEPSNRLIVDLGRDFSRRQSGLYTQLSPEVFSIDCSQLERRVIAGFVSTLDAGEWNAMVDSLDRVWNATVDDRVPEVYRWPPERAHDGRWMSRRQQMLQVESIEDVVQASAHDEMDREYQSAPLRTDDDHSARGLRPLSEFLEEVEELVGPRDMSGTHREDLLEHLHEEGPDKGEPLAPKADFLPPLD